MAKNERFVTVHKEGTMFQRKVLVDKETGVNYLWISEGYAGGLTLLLDKDGKPVVTPVTDFDE
ncbi:MAG: xylan 1,4-beta-xylosidase [Ruminococcus sp.]|nr:xylan 1,4-beta-xylosidase [Ruminococcus sp.]